MNTSSTSKTNSTQPCVELGAIEVCDRKKSARLTASQLATQHELIGEKLDFLTMLEKNTQLISFIKHN